MEVYDFVGKELSVGDWVALSMESQTALTHGKIVKISFSEKTKNNTISVEVLVTDKFLKGKFKLGIRHRRPHNVIKIDRECAIQRTLEI